MAKQKFTVADLRGISIYLRVRADSTKKSKRALLIHYADVVSWAADSIDINGGTISERG